MWYWTRLYPLCSKTQAIKINALRNRKLKKRAAGVIIRHSKFPSICPYANFLFHPLITVNYARYILSKYSNMATWFQKRTYINVLNKTFPRRVMKFHGKTKLKIKYRSNIQVVSVRGQWWGIGDGSSNPDFGTFLMHVLYSRKYSVKCADVRYLTTSLKISALKTWQDQMEIDSKICGLWYSKENM